MTIKELRILQVLLSDRLGGAETLARSLQGEWIDAGAICEIAYVDPGNPQPHTRLRRLANLRRSIREFKPSVIVAHSALPMCYSRLVTPFSIPIVDVLHSSGRDYKGFLFRQFETLTQRRSVVAVAVSEVAGNIYRHQISVNRRVEVIENGVRSLEPAKRHSSQRVRVVTIARVALEKRPELWSDVAAAFDQKTVSFEWHGPYRGNREAEEFVKAHQDAEKPGTFEGPTDHPGLVLANADVLFHPASREAQGVAILEAVLAKVPVVCSKPVAKGLIPGIIAREFDESNAEISAVIALREIIDSLESQSQFVEERAAAVESRYGIVKCADAYLRLIRGLV